ncbi:MAG: tetraacyldisaccharide 4'-kinase [Gammaproteobacteria bacterium]|nr:tetraacyldisaccharide 4'-kinase [Gammaproteobacteria bacterium]
MRLERWLLDVWYGGNNKGGWLSPLGWLFRSASGLRRWLYRAGWLSQHHPGVPLIVVGNISSGGTGKTPLVIWLAKELQAAGLRVGLLSRGYRGTAKSWPQQVTADSDPVLVGDEAVLLARRSLALVVVDPDRVAGARELVKLGAEVIICDDGLQHYRLSRDLEFAVIDGARGIGNGRFIPAGPLREAPSRLQTVDSVIVNNRTSESAWPGSLAMKVTATHFVSLNEKRQGELAELAGKTVHAVAGIGNPSRFFDLLQGFNINIERHEFADHAIFHEQDLQFNDGLPVLMTEKDAVKCRTFSNEQLCYVPVEAQFSEADANELRGQMLRFTRLSGSVTND